ncbi:MAG: GtrA family protein [Pseudomonadota bacterium]|jgi:putative flippase GtrA
MHKAASQLLRFGVAGVLGLLVDTAVLYGALALGAGPYGGRLLSFLAAVWTTWQFNRRYTFAAGGPAWREWWRYLSAMGAGALLNLGVYAAVMRGLPPAAWLPFAAVCAGSLAGMGVNFLSAKYLVFRAR